MIAGLGSIIDRVAGLFGKTYLLAGFFPVLLLAAVSLIAGHDSSEWIYRQVEAFRAMDAGRQALASGALLVVVAMMGFVFWSANPWWRALLQGTALPGFLRRWMSRDQQRQLEKLEADVERSELRVFAFRIAFPDAEPEPEPDPEPALPQAPAPPQSVFARLARWLFGPPASPPPAVLPAAVTAGGGDGDGDGDGDALPWQKRLSRARAEGDAKTGVAPVAPSAALRKQYDAVRARIRGLKPVEAAELDGLCAKLEKELALAPVAPQKELDNLQVGFSRLAALARARAENEYSRTLSVRRMRFPLDLAAVGPTRMANVAELYRDHALSRYQLDPELMWLQLQHSAAKDEHFRPILEEARLKLDVSVALAMACGVASLWTLWLGFRGHSIAVLLLTGLGFPLAALLFYRATITNLRVYGEAVTATVQLFRFDVLKALHLPLPADSEAERRLWETLTLTDQLLDDGRVTYVHP
ncbi:hypothetical protein [Longimicrobium sp.]|uniref:hypothetical protein n=1 Tax=Longimicrobium sp. TaxID=2029185 RepID=UPI002C45DBD3|nr:hypothetical protein [Longimicrobium sp.]HSU17202.1 hypothetical protein [Longimicrobium sp.]